MSAKEGEKGTMEIGTTELAKPGCQENKQLAKQTPPTTPIFDPLKQMKHTATQRAKHTESK